MSTRGAAGLALAVGLLAVSATALATASATATATATATVPAPASASASESEAARQERFLYLLRTYPERPADETLGQVAALVDQGPFSERDRAIYWLGSARLSLGDRPGLRRWYERLRREYPGSVWVERSHLGMAEAASQERRFGEALRWYALADRAGDAAVRELGRISRMQVLILQTRQRVAWTGQLLALAIALWFFASALRLERARLAAITAQTQGQPQAGARAALRALLTPPSEARVLFPVLVVLSLIALPQDPAPRGAVLELAGGGAALTWLSGARLRALGPGLSRSARLAQGGLALLAMACVAYAAVWRGDLIGMVLETIRAGPD